MKKLLILTTLINFSCFSMELNYPEKEIPILSNNSNQPIFLDKSVIEYSEFLKTFFEIRKEYASENIKFDFNHEDLKNAVDIINLFLEVKSDSSKEDHFLAILQGLSLQDLINTYYISDYFMMNELKEILGPLFNKPEFIKELSQLDQEQLQGLEFVKTNAFLPGQAPEPLLKNVSRIDWSPDRSRYFVTFKDHSGQLFDKDGNSIGNSLSNVMCVSWSPNESYYFVKYFNDSGRLFNSEGNLIQRNIRWISWSPDGSFYFVKFNYISGQLFDKYHNPTEFILYNAVDINWAPDGSRCFIEFSDHYHSGQLFDNNGKLVGLPLNNVWYISWSPDGSQYFARFRDDTRLLYDREGNVILNNIRCIYWSPDGAFYFIESNNSSAQLFDKDGNTIGSILNDVVCIYWSPNGSQYFVEFKDNSTQLFDKDGNSIGSLLSNFLSIYWSPDGSYFFVKYGDNSGQLFDKERNRIGYFLNDVDCIYWSLDGSHYFVKRGDNSRQLFNNNGKSTLYFPNIKKYEWCSNNTLMLISDNDNLYQNSLKFLVQKLANGYQIYRAKDKLPIGHPLKNKPLWLDTNNFKVKEENQEDYYSYQEKYFSYQALTLPNLVNKIRK